MAVAPRPANQATACSTARSGCSNAAAVGTISTSSQSARCSRWLSSPWHGSVHSPPPSSAIDPVPFFTTTPLWRYVPAAVRSPSFDAMALRVRSGRSYGRGRDATPGRIAVPAGNLSASTGGGYGDQAGRHRRFGDHGLGRRRGRGEGGHRGGAAQPRAGDGRRDGRRPREVAGQAGRAGQARRRASATRCSAGCARSPTSASSPTATSCSSRSSRTSPPRSTCSTSSTASAPSGAILATNTSTLPVIEMAMETGRPDRVCGIHFFNPAPMMALVEVVRAITTSRRDDQRGHRVRRPRAARTPCRSRTRPGSSSTRCCSRTSTTRRSCSTPASPPATTSTRR